jgi:hypothetical protein
MDWDDARQTLTISSRTGTYAGMPAARELRIVKVDGKRGIGIAESKGKTVVYKGEQMVVKL